MSAQYSRDPAATARDFTFEIEVSRAVVDQLRRLGLQLATGPVIVRRIGHCQIENRCRPGFQQAVSRVARLLKHPVQVRLAGAGKLPSHIVS